MQYKMFKISNIFSTNEKKYFRLNNGSVSRFHKNTPWSYSQLLFEKYFSCKIFSL